MQKKQNSEACIRSKCKKETSQIDALSAASRKLGDKARELVQKGNTVGARKASQEAYDLWKKPNAKKIMSSAAKCSVTKCEKEIRAYKQKQLSSYETKCKEKGLDSIWCKFAKDLKKELAGNAKKLKVQL